MMISKAYGLMVQPRFLTILFAVVAFAWLATLPNRYIEADECILGEYSYSFLNEGIVRVKSIPAIQDWDVRLFPHHRFFTWFGAGVIALFGWSITWFKISMLPWYGLFFFFLYKYLKLKNATTESIVWSALLVFSAPIILLKSYSFRPDILLMMEGMALLYFLSRFREYRKAQDLAYAGFFAGLGFLTHLNGAAFCIAGFLFLLFTKEYKALITYTAVGAIVGGIYFIELLPQGNFQKFIDQLTNWPTVNHGENFIGSGPFDLIWGRIQKLLSEHQRFFWGDKVIGFSVVFFLSLLLSFKRLKNEYGDLLLFMLLLVLSLNIFGSHVAERYILFYYGPMAAISGLAVHFLLEAKPWKKVLFQVGLVLHFMFSVMMINQLFSKAANYPALHAEIYAHITENDAKILVPYEMIYNEFPERDLYVFKTYEYLQEGMEDKQMTQNQLFTKAEELGMDYIIINEKMATYKGNWFYGWEVDENPFYEVKYQDKNAIILERLN